MIHVIMFLLKLLSFSILLLSNLLSLVVALLLWDYKFIISTKYTYKCIFDNPIKKDIQMTIMFNKIWKSIVGNNFTNPEDNPIDPKY